MNLGLRTMQAEDIEEVLSIEKEAFSPLWPGTSFKRQLNNRYSDYLVAYDVLAQASVDSIDTDENTATAAGVTAETDPTSAALAVALS